MMRKTEIRTEEEARAGTANGKSSRLFFIDYLRVFLILLVILHHVALVYGAGAPFYYQEPPVNDPLAFLLLLVFVLFNQAWFMGAFFLLAGYFTPGSYDRKGPAAFLKSRLLRLGLPVLFFYFVLNPVSSIGYWQMPAGLTGITAPLTWKAYPRLLGLGPMWFALMLLVFDLGYAAWRRLKRNRPSTASGGSNLPGFFQTGAFILVLALASYLVRLIVPLGEYVLEFPTLAYLPQYLGMFVVGAAASRLDWFRRLPASLGAAGFTAAVSAGILLFPLAFSGRMFSLEVAAVAEFVGKGHWQSAVYALWDSTFAVGMCLGTVVLFRRFFSRKSGLIRSLSQHSYLVYILHIPIIVLVAVAMKGVQIPALLKFGLAAVIAVPVCFAAAWGIRKLPGLARIV